MSENDTSILKHLKPSINHRYKIEIAIYYLHYYKRMETRNRDKNVGRYHSQNCNYLCCIFFFNIPIHNIMLCYINYQKYIYYIYQVGRQIF